MGQLPQFPRDARTSNGVRYRIRPMRPDDAGRERDFIRRMTPDSRYQRFMHAIVEPGEALVQSLVHTEFPCSLALVAVIEEAGAERIIGVARYASDDPRECEFAVAVADDWQCRGIGTTLVPLLFECATQAGFEIVYGTVLAGNQRMIELAEWLGLTVDAPRRGEETVRAWRRLDGR